MQAQIRLYAILHPRTTPMIVTQRLPPLISMTFKVGILRIADAAAPITKVFVLPSFCAHQPPNSVNGILKMQAIIVMIYVWIRGIPSHPVQ